MHANEELCEVWKGIKRKREIRHKLTTYGTPGLDVEHLICVSSLGSWNQCIERKASEWSWETSCHPLGMERGAQGNG